MVWTTSFYRLIVLSSYRLIDVDWAVNWQLGVGKTVTMGSSWGCLMVIDGRTLAFPRSFGGDMRMKWR